MIVLSECVPHISKISLEGLVTIYFSEPIKPISLEAVNSSNTLLYVEPASNRQNEPTFELETVNFTWSAVGFTDRTL